MKKFILGLLSISLLTASLVGCSGTSTQEGATPAPKASASAASGNAGSLTCVGSTALLPFVEKAAQSYMKANPNDAKITVNGGGSGTGLSQVLSGACDIGNSDIYAEEKLKPEDPQKLVDNKVCVIGFATVVNSKVAIESLTKQQLKDVFGGVVKNWKEVGGNDLQIVILNRPTSSGTRATFKKYALDGMEEAQGTGLTEESSGAVKKTVNETDGAVSYLAINYVDKDIKAIKLDGVEANAANITEGKYPIWSYGHMYTKGKPTGSAEKFLQFIMGDEVQKKILPSLKYVPVSDMKVSKDK